jgi:hypothetical protein
LPKSTLQNQERKATSSRIYNPTDEPDLKAVEVIAINLDCKPEQDIVKEREGGANSDSV